MRTPLGITQAVPATAPRAIAIALCLVVVIVGSSLLAGDDGAVPPDPYMTALPPLDQAKTYWLSRASDLVPFDRADATVIGTVAEVVYVREAQGRAYGMEMAGYLTRAELALDCDPAGVGGEPRTITVEYFTPSTAPLSSMSPDPYALKPTTRYLLLLRRAHGGQAWDTVPAQEYGPPPTPLAAATNTAPADASAMGMITSQLVASARSGEGQLPLYAIPVLGYLAQFEDRNEARSCLMELCEADDETTASAALRALTRWGWTSEELAAVLDKCTSSDSAVISGAAIAARLWVGDASAFAELAGWCARPDLPEGAMVEVASMVYVWPGELVTEEVLREVGELLDTSVPVRVRTAAVQLLNNSLPRASSMAAGPMTSPDDLAARARVAPLLMRALDDPDLQVRHRTVQGLYKAAEGWDHPELREYSALFDAFSRDPDHYTDQWKAWWQVNGEALPEPPPPPPPPPPPQFVH